MQALTLALFVQAAVGLAASLIAHLGGVLNAFGWLNVLLTGIFAAGLGYYRFIRPEGA